MIRAELGRILASERFVNANRISTLLRYVVEEALAGRRDRLKAFSIAQYVFGRDASFDQQRDPIVRVEASRLTEIANRFTHLRTCCIILPPKFSATPWENGSENRSASLLP